MPEDRDTFDAVGIDGTGIYQPTPPQLDRIPEYDKELRRHFWIVMTCYRVEPERWEPTTNQMLDNENLVSVQGPGCYYCEQPYSSWAAAKKCRGEEAADA